jgi:hypothetical protein
VGVQAHSEESGEEGAGEDGPLSKQDSWWEGCFLATVELDTGKSDDQKSKAK